MIVPPTNATSGMSLPALIAQPTADLQPRRPPLPLLETAAPATHVPRAAGAPRIPRLDIGTLRPSAPSAQAAQVAALVGGHDLDAPLDATTDHALLVLLGKYAQHLGLIERLEAVPIEQRTRDHAPQTKLIQFFVGILAGLEYLQDFNTAPQPLVQDQAVIASWLQEAFAHYSGVSRTLAAADATTLAGVIQVLQEVSQPFLDAEVLALVRQGQPLTVDVDLTGRRVSPTSTTYPDADFGWMDDAVAKGYQAAITTLSGGPGGRLVLGSQRYAGRTKSAECLQAAVRQAEQVLGLHPRRRTELVQQRLDALTLQLHQQQARLEAARLHQQQLHLLAQQLQADVQQALADLTAHGGERPTAAAAEQRADQTVRLRKCLTRLHQRQQHVQTRLQTEATRLGKLEAQGVAVQTQHTQLTVWLETLLQENARDGAPLPIILRVDAGFSTDNNLTWLIEMGYTVVTKVHSGHTTTRLCRMVASNAGWTAVGGNAEAVTLPPQRLTNCPYAVEVLLVCYHLPRGPRYTTLLYYGDTPPPASLGAWFRLYNARQIMEAGIKEQKGVFTMRRPLVRSRIGLQLQEQLSVFATNFVRWAAEWAKQLVRQATPRLWQALGEVKTLVRVVAHSRARVVHTPQGCGLLFDAHGPFANSVLVFVGQVAYQEVLPLFKGSPSAPSEVT